MAIADYTYQHSFEERELREMREAREYFERGNDDLWKTKSDRILKEKIMNNEYDYAPKALKQAPLPPPPPAMILKPKDSTYAMDLATITDKKKLADNHTRGRVQDLSTRYILEGSGRRATHIPAVFTDQATFESVSIITVTPSRADPYADSLVKFKAFNDKKKIPCLINEDSTIASFLMEGIQVNWMILPEKSMPDFYSYEDFGNLYIPIAKSMGFDLDPTGLYMPVGDSKILVSNVWVNIENILGVSIGHNRSYYGVKLQDAYPYLTKAAYFNKDSYLKDGAEFKPSDKFTIERGINFTHFNQLLNKPITKNNFDFNSGNKPWIKNIQQNYPHVVAEYKDYIHKVEFGNLFQSKFNLAKIQEIVELPETRMKDFFEMFEKQFKSNYEFKTFVLTSLPDTLKKKLLEVKEKMPAELKIFPRKGSVLSRLTDEEAKIISNAAKSEVAVATPVEAPKLTAVKKVAKKKPVVELSVV